MRNVPGAGGAGVTTNKRQQRDRARRSRPGTPRGAASHATPASATRDRPRRRRVLLPDRLGSVRQRIQHDHQRREYGVRRLPQESRTAGRSPRAPAARRRTSRPESRAHSRSATRARPAGRSRASRERARSSPAPACAPPREAPDAARAIRVGGRWRGQSSRHARRAGGRRRRTTARIPARTRPTDPTTSTAASAHSQTTQAVPGRASHSPSAATCSISSVRTAGTCAPASST